VSLSRRDKILNGVYRALGENRIHQRWIKPKRKSGVVYGLADDERIIITVSPMGLIAYLVHECLHQAFPSWTERGVVSATSYLLARMSDDECRALYEAYASKVVIMAKPTTEAE
jgi:hypothetical protein